MAAYTYNNKSYAYGTGPLASQYPVNNQQNNQNSGITEQQRQAEILRIQEQLASLKQQAAEKIQEKITGLQGQVQNAQNAGYGEGGQYAGQDVPENILNGGYDTGNEQMNGILNQMQTFLNNTLAAGQTINPEIELTPAQISQFTDLASSQISPYYRQQIDSIKTDLSKSIENLQKQYEVTKQGAEAEFKQSLGTSRESNAGAGLTFSGNRGQQEQGFVNAQNRSLDLNALQMEGEIGSNLRNIEGQIGSSNLPGMPSFQGYQATLEGQGGFTPGRTLNFSGTGGIEGSLQKQQREAELLRLSKYKTAAREGRSLDFYL